MKRKFVPVFLLSLTWIILSIGKTEAAGNNPDSGLPPDGAPRVLLPNALAWFQFQYNGDRSSIEIVLGASDVPDIGFSVYTPDEIAAWRRGDSLRAIGQSARSGSVPYRDLVWNGAFSSAGTFFVAVRNGMSIAVAYRLSVAGAGVHFAPALIPSTLVPDSTSQVSTPLQLLPSRPRPSAVRVPILMYHHLRYLGPFASRVLRSLTVAPGLLEQQAAYLATHDYHAIYFADLVAYFRGQRALPDNPIILTFDDGWREDYTVAYPILRKYGLVATFFPPTNYVDHSPSTLTWAEVKEMSAAGMEFGSHTLDHPFLTRQTTERVRQELVYSKAILESELRKPVVAFAYPYGAYNGLIAIMVAQAGYGVAVTTNGGIYQNGNSPFTLRRTTIPFWYNLGAFAASLGPGPILPSRASARVQANAGGDEMVVLVIAE